MQVRLVEPVAYLSEVSCAKVPFSRVAFWSGVFFVQCVADAEGVSEAPRRHHDGQRQLMRSAAHYRRNISVSQKKSVVLWR